METKKLLVTLEERREIQREMSKEFGTKIKYRVIDLDKVVEKIQQERLRFALSPYVEIKPVSPDMHKNPSKTSTFQKDPITGVLYGIPIDQDEFGNMRWQKIQISDNLSLNLDNVNDAKIWAVIRFNPEIKGSPFQVQFPYYEIYDPIEVARTEMSEVTQMKKAFDRIDTIKERPVDMVMLARYIGEELRENSNYDIVYNTLLRFARNYPAEFNRKWENKARAYAERLATATALGIVSKNPDKGYIFKNIPIGFNDDEAVRFLSKDIAIMESINSEIKKSDVVIHGILREMKKSSEKNPQLDPKLTEEKKSELE